MENTFYYLSQVGELTNVQFNNGDVLVKRFIELRAWAVEMGESGPYAKEKHYGVYLYGKSAENFNLMPDIFVAANIIAVPVNAGSEKESRLRLTMISPVTM